MGQVFKARHRVMDRVVALKVVRPELLARPVLVRRFHQEIKAAAQVSHSNLVIAHDAAEVDGRHFLVMEYVEGVGVDRLIARGPLPIPLACDLVRQASLGLAHIAEKGLVHRDIKPSNLLVASKDSTLKILDMGLARLNAVVEGDAGPNGLESTLTDSGVVMGTADYLSPEQALDARRADIRADIYSLGCTFYHMLSGRPPFPGGSLAQKLLRHQQERPDDLRQLRLAIPEELASIVLTMMARRPEDRFQTPADVSRALTSLGGGPGLRRLTLDPTDPTSLSPRDRPGSSLAAVVHHQPSSDPDTTYALADPAPAPESVHIPVDDLDLADEDEDIPIDDSPGVAEDEDWADDEDNDLEDDWDAADELPRRRLHPALELALLIAVPAMLTGTVIWLVLRQLGYLAGR
jgi:serine/threonine protein kinase